MPVKNPPQQVIVEEELPEEKLQTLAQDAVVKPSRLEMTECGVEVLRA